MTEREKIVEIVLDTEITGIKLRNITGGISTANAIADALIEAGYGDVKERKFEADHYWRMWQGSLVELERAEHRAKVAEQALRKACEHIDGVAETCAVCAKLADKLKAGEVCDRAENCVDNAIKFLTRQAEKELVEEKEGKYEKY